MPALDRALSLLRGLFLICANLILLAMLVANAVNILWRAVFGAAFNLVFPWTMMGFLWLTFIGFYVYVHDRRDVVVDMVVKHLPRPLRMLCALIAFAVTIAVLVVILGSLPDVIATQGDRIDMVGLPRFSMVLPLFLSAALVLVITIRRLPEMLSGTFVAPEHPPEGAD